jgi:hypothetical protein
MGHNVDMREFGIAGLKCSKCNSEIDDEISELDIDCDLKTHNPNCFELTISCFNCEYENHVKYKLSVVKE